MVRSLCYNTFTILNNGVNGFRNGTKLREEFRTSSYEMRYEVFDVSILQVWFQRYHNSRRGKGQPADNVYFHILDETFIVFM